jgi:hypothetical protein
MINNWQSFKTKKLLESLSGDILLEGMVYTTSNFVNKLEQIRQISDNKELLSLISSLLYSFSRGMLHKGNIYTVYDIEDSKDSKITQNYIDSEENSDKVSAFPSSKITGEFSPDYFKSTMRNEIKVGRFLKYLCDLLGISVSDSTVEKFVNEWKSLNESESASFEVVSGKDIWRYYQTQRYKNENGTLGGSCMNDETSSVLKIYIDNAKLIILKDGDKIIGRALLWHLTKSPVESKWFMDRIYTTIDYSVNTFKRYADEMGYLYKKEQDSHLENNVNFMWKKKEVSGVISVDIKGECEEYPFIDTLCFLNRTKTKLTNVPTRKCYWLHSVYGECSRCENCNGKIIDDDELCRYCCPGHVELKELGIETKWNKLI